MVGQGVTSIQFDRFHQILYHGTTSTHYLSLIEGVDLQKCNPYTDFGQGFYLTSNFDQASKHAKKRCFRADETPIVFVYAVDIAALRTYKDKMLRTMDLDWAHFVYHNRSTTKQLKHRYDYAVGGVADGQLDDLIEMLDNGRISMQTFYESIAKYAAYDQWSVHNQMIIDHNVIRFNKVVNAFAKGQDYTHPGAGGTVFA